MAYITADDVLKEIEFELAQGVVSRQDLRHAIQTVKQFHGRLRGEVFGATGQATDWREAASRQFQINDMLITLLQEMAGAAQDAQIEARLAREALDRAREAGLADDRAPNAPRSAPFDPSDWQPPAEITDAMRVDSLLVQFDVRAPAIPIIGGLVKRVRVALHSLARFYVMRLAQKQTPINRAYGDWLLHLTRLCQRQQAEIDTLNLRLAALWAERRDTPRPSA